MYVDIYFTSVNIDDAFSNIFMLRNGILHIRALQLQNITHTFIIYLHKFIRNIENTKDRQKLKQNFITHVLSTL